ncbi:hypothetical protein GCM10007036_14260 [Alsobacter metallidurans]|uniref:Uncharacterized protein n=1 Tax=Alsobacter metallidurans TaxID=340221 RepID=A0A917I5G4_9HYPH|nr:hypothetical protein [Alsobacter metallidurans]GGH14744.1 hypothetical protein GCM10007036_14260 [Alsobacter metallidurans]
MAKAPKAKAAAAVGLIEGLHGLIGEHSDEARYHAAAVLHQLRQRAEELRAILPHIPRDILSDDIAAQVDALTETL